MRMSFDDKATILKIIKKYGYEPDDLLKKRILAIKSDPTMEGITPKPVKKNMGGMMSSTKKKPTGSATGLTGMKRGGMTMKKKGYAKGGMKKKGMSKGGAARRGR